MAAAHYEIDHNEADEEDFLLTNSRPATAQPQKSFFPQARSPRSVILLLFTIIFILSFAGHIMGVPALRIYEDIICHQVYDDMEGDGHIGLDEDIDESKCKGDEVQKQLNILLAVLHFLGAIPGIIATIPYGLLADRIGRRPVFLLSVCGMLIGGIYNACIMYFWRTLPIRLVWLSPLFVLIGGGEGVTGMLFYAIGSDVTTDANRGNVFLFGASAVFASELIAPSLSSILMARSPWIPFLGGMVILALGMVPALFISETLHSRRSVISRSNSITSDSDSEEIFPDSELSKFFTALRVQMADGMKRLHDSISILNSMPILLLLLPFIIGPFGQQSMGLSLRYISKRFSWSLSQTNFLLTLRAVVNLVLLGAILPGVSYYLTERLYFSSKEKDLSIARVSAILLVLGSLLMAASPAIGLTIFGLVTLTLGTGFGSLVRSLITAMVDKEHVARLHATISIVETVSALTASPTIGGLYALGLRWKGAWIGLPFFGVAVICFFGGLGVWCFGFLKKPQEEMPYGDEDRETLLGSTLVLDGDIAETDIINVV